MLPGLAGRLPTFGIRSHGFTKHSPPPPPPKSDFTDLFSRFLQVQDDFSSEIFSITAWLIWNRRNAQHFGHLVHPGEKLIAGIRNCLGV